MQRSREAPCSEASEHAAAKPPSTLQRSLRARCSEVSEHPTAKSSSTLQRSLRAPYSDFCEHSTPQRLSTLQRRFPPHVGGTVLMSRSLSRELMAEFLGTFILIVFGVASVAQVVLSRNTAGTYLSINIAWGLAVTMGCYVSAGVTGGHLNPAVRLALAAQRRFPWSKVLPYSAAQIAGAVVASAVVFVTSQ